MRIAGLLLALWICVSDVTDGAQPFLFNRRLAFKTTASGPSYLISQGWESGSEPSGWGHIGSGVNYNYITTVLEGSKSLGILGTVDSATTNVYTAQSTIVHLFMFRATALPAGVINGIGITDHSGNALTYVGLNASGTWTLNIVGGGSATTTDAISANTTYYLKHKWTPGSPGTATFEFSATGTFTNSASNKFASRSDTLTTQPGGISLENYSSGNTWIFDHVRAYPTDLGDFANWP
jgi:hypothetical protein